MAVKVINRKPAKSALRKRICKNCGVTVTYLPKDVKENSYTDIGGGTEHWTYIICPDCKEIIVLKSWY